MANLYSFFDGGTFETFGSSIESVFENDNLPPSGTLLAQMQRSTDFAASGVASGKLTFKAFKTNSAIYRPNLGFYLSGFLSGARPLLTTFSTAGDYIIRVKVYTPSLNPIGSDSLVLRLAPYIHAFGSPLNTTVATPAVITKKTVLQCKDSWQQLEYRITVNPGQVAYIGIVADDSTLRVSDLVSGIAWDFAGTLNVNGVLYLDDITVEKVVACDLAFGSPAFEKSNESISGASDGVIVVHATSSFFIQYSLDGVTYQSSNVFSGLPSGIYTIYAKDTNPSGCTISQAGVIITVAECDLAIGSYSKTNETATGANNGSVTISASSSVSITYSIDNVTFVSSPVFSGLAPGFYDFHIKDARGCTGQVLDVQILAFNAPPETPTDLQIDLTPVNSFNFITWFSSIGDVSFKSTTLTNCINGLPKPYRLNKPDAIRHYPWIVNAEQFSFYINFDTPFSDADFTSFQLHVINIYGIVQTDVAPLQRVFDADGVSYFIYANVTLAGLPPGNYRLAIVNMALLGSIIYTSQEIKVVTTSEARYKSIRLQFRNSSNLYKFLYESIPDFVQQIRLRMAALEENIEGDLEQYRSSSSGLLRNVNVELDLAIKIETYYFDDLAHRAMFIFEIDDFMILNGKSYLVKSIYKPDWSNPGRKTSKGLFEVYDQSFSSSNRYGNTEDIVIVDSDDPLLLGDGGGFIKL